MKKQKHVSPTVQSNPAIDQRTVWERLAQAGGVSEERLRVWGSDEAGAVVDPNQQHWRFELRSPTCNGTFVSPYKFHSLKLLKDSPQPGKSGAKLALTFDARNEECRRIWPQLAGYVLDEVAKAKWWKSRPNGIIKALKDWKHHWPKEKGFNDPEFLKGLFGELCLINWLLEKEVSAEMALGAWMGPKKSLHDFQFQGCHVEVKASAGKRREVTISDLRQLDESIAGVLFLAHIRLAKTKKKEDSLAALVEKIEQKLADSQKELMTTKLKLSRWFQIEQHVRDTTIFHSSPPEFFTVVKGFPRLLEKDLRITGVIVTKYKVSPLPAPNGEFSIDGAKVLAALR